ncbi:major facilitator superfamily domain-containing protein [Aspergillus cavernicola]|uniref:Major facilitator superfamily domain-containing protein n=1 Tax=Aspergillus cavernicola TaxID=176166 RepID=A0ABR4J135_9EURO
MANIVDKVDSEQIEDVELKAALHNLRAHLVPRPSEDEGDPLNWPMNLKLLILCQVCWLAFTTITIAMNGVGPFIWISLANVYGRRFVYLFTTLIGFGTALGCGFTNSFATVTDLFFYHQRGRALGLFTVMLTSGAHFAALFGGPVAKFVGWRRIFWITAAMNFCTLAVLVVALPETMYYKPRTYSDTNTEAPKLTMEKYQQLLRPWATFPGVRLKAKHIVIPAFRMALYPSVLFPSLYYASQYCFTAIFPAVTYSIIFQERCWNPFQCGMAYGGTMTIGSIASEFAAGRIIDKIIRREATRLNVDNPPPEVRFKGLWTGAALVPAGLLIFGCTMHYKTHWVGPLAGMFIGIFGIQIIATVCYTYSIDSYRVEGSEVAQFFNFCRQSTSCTIAFYGVDLCKRIGYQYAFLMLRLWGVSLLLRRERLGKPRNVSVAEEIIAGYGLTRP